MQPFATGSDNKSAFQAVKVSLSGKVVGFLTDQRSGPKLNYHRGMVREPSFAPFVQKLTVFENGSQ